MNDKKPRTKSKYRWTERKPIGGYCLIHGTALLAAWWALICKRITLRDIRAWLGCFELVERRKGSRSTRTPRFTVRELHSLLGGPPERAVRQSLRRLESAGLLAWSDARVALSGGHLRLPPAGKEELLDWLAGIENHARPIPVPRQTLRYLAREGNRSVLGTAIGHLVRCMYLRDGRVVSGGRCKASWVATVFGLHERTVKTARRELERSKWLLRIPSSQRALNTWGPATVINLRWRREPVRRESPPPRPASGTGSPPPIKNKKLFYRRVQNQKPPNGRSIGAQERPRKAEPQLSAVHSTDLNEPDRIDALFRRAVQRGVVQDTTCDRLRVFAAATHALRYGKANPPGLFVWLVRRQMWDFITQQDEDLALRQIKRLDYGEDPVLADFEGLTASGRELASGLCGGHE